MVAANNANSRPLLILQCDILADSFEGRPPMAEMDELFLRGLDLGDHPSRVSRVCRGEVPPGPEEVAGALVTGAGAMASDPDQWIADTAAWLLGAFGAGVPLLGVCFGHQLLAHALGGHVAALPGGPEYCTTEVKLHERVRDDPLFGSLPDRFPAQAAHYQFVADAPPRAVVLAESAAGIEALRFGPNAWGVQFHPEFCKDEQSALIEALRAPLTAAGSDVDRDRAGVESTPDAARILTHFRDLVFPQQAPVTR